MRFSSQAGFQPKPTSSSMRITDKSVFNVFFSRIIVTLQILSGLSQSLHLPVTAQGVFLFAPTPPHHAQAYGWGLGADAGKETERCQVAGAVGSHSSDQGDRTGNNQRDEKLVQVPVLQRSWIDYHNCLHSLIGAALFAAARSAYCSSG